MRHRFLVLSPGYDLNPNPHNPTRLSTAIDRGDTTASIEAALSVCGYFRMSSAGAREIAAGIERATSAWQRVAADLGLPRDQTDLMVTAYQTSQRQAARALAGS